MDLQSLGISETQLLVNLLLAFCLGAIVGLRNEITHASPRKTMLGGFRTYGLAAVLFYLIGLVGAFSNIAVSMLIATVAIMVIVFYTQHLLRFHTKSMSMELSFMLTVFLAYLWGSGILSFKLVFTVSVLVSFLMAYKSNLKQVFLGFNERELKEILLFFVLVAVLLPWVPQGEYSIVDVLNYIGVAPTHVGKWAYLQWFSFHKFLLIISVFILVELLGHVLTKFVSRSQALLWESLVGGFISSTTATVSISRSAIREGVPVTLASYSIVLATLVSFISTLFLVLPFGTRVSVALLSLFSPMYVGMIILGWLLYQTSQKYNSRTRLNATNATSEPRSIVDIGAAVKFALLVIVLRMVLELVRLYFGDSLFIITTLLLGVTGIDVATLTLASLVVSNSLDISNAIRLFIGVNIVNLLAKLFYLYWANRHNKQLALSLVKRVGIGYFAIILVFVLVYVFL